MKTINLLILLLVVLTSRIHAQGIESYFFDYQKGVYVIHYKWSQNDTLRKAIYVPANQVSPEINASVTLDQTNDNFRYDFQVENKNIAKHPLFSINIEFFVSVENIKSPSSDWWSRKLDNKKGVRWIKRKGPIPGIEAGKSIEGFSFTSKGLPRMAMASFSSLTHTFHPETDEPVLPHGGGHRWQISSARPSGELPGWPR